MRFNFLAPMLGVIALGLCLGCSPCGDQCPHTASDYPIPFCRISSNGVGCSATLIDRNHGRGLVITCEHCVGGQEFRCRFTNGQTVNGHLIAESPNHDLAAFVIDDIAVQPAKLGGYTAQGTYRAFGFGGANPTNQLYKLEGTVIESGMNYPGRPCCENISCTPIGGDSGSGTLNDQDEFVGVLWGGNERGALITCGTPVTEFLTDLVKRGLWQPSPSFTPGGMPLASARNTLPAYQCSGPAWESCRRGYYNPPQQRVIVRELQPIWYGCPPGRTPIDPRDVTPRPPARPIDVSGNTALFAFAAVMGLIGAVVLYFNRDDSTT